MRPEEQKQNVPQNCMIIVHTRNQAWDGSITARVNLSFVLVFLG